MTPTARTLAYLRERGWIAWVVERWNPHSRIRVDLWGFGDILAMRGACVLIVQATSMSNITARQAKIDTNEIAREWRAEPNRLLWVIGWRKLKGKGRQQWWPCVREWTRAGEWIETATGSVLTPHWTSTDPTRIGTPPTRSGPVDIAPGKVAGGERKERQ